MRLLSLSLVIFFCAQNALTQVNDLKFQMPRESFIKLLHADNVDNSRFEGILSVSGQSYPETKIHFKGHTSRLFPKRGLALKFTKKTQPPALFKGLTEINLNPMYTDKSFIREKLTWDFFEKMHGFGPKEIGYVRLFINEINFGVYILIQPINEKFLITHNKKGQDLFEAREGLAVGNLKPAPEDYLQDAYKKKDFTEKSYLNLQKMITKLNATPTDDVETAKIIHDLFDMNSVYNWFTLNALTMQGDSYSKNYFLYNEPKKTSSWHTIPWDYDISFGRDGNPVQPYPQQILNDLFAYSYPVLSGPDNALKEKILKNSVLLNEFKQKLKFAIENILADENLMLQIEELAKILEPYVNQEPIRWGAKSEFKEQIEALKYFTEVRKNYLLNQFINPPTGEINEATLNITNKNKTYNFVDKFGKTIAQLNFSEFTNLKAITVKVYPTTLPPYFNGDRIIKRYVELIPNPVNAKFKASLIWEYFDDNQFSEVTAGVTQDFNLQAYNFIKGNWTKIPSSANSYANYIRQKINETNCGKGNYFAAKDSNPGPIAWKKISNANWQRWLDAKSISAKTIVVAGDDGTIFHSKDQGNTWTSIFVGSHSQLKSLAILNEQTLLVTNQVGEIFKSEDTGLTWKTVINPAEYELNSIDFIDDKNGFVVGNKGTIMSTVDGGSTWNKTAIDDTNFHTIKMLTKSEILIAGTSNIILKSPDAGKTWKKIIASKESNFSINRILRISDKEIWAVADKGKILNSHDAGETWQTFNIPTTANLTAISEGPKNSIYVAGEDGALFVTTDKKNWSKENLGFNNDLQALLHLTSSQRLLAFGNSASIFIRQY